MYGAVMMRGPETSLAGFQLSSIFEPYASCASIAESLILPERFLSEPARCHAVLYAPGSMRHVPRSRSLADNKSSAQCMFIETNYMHTVHKSEPC